jgi:hypothetical protein
MSDTLFIYSIKFRGNKKEHKLLELESENVNEEQLALNKGSVRDTISHLEIHEVCKMLCKDEENVIEYNFEEPVFVKYCENVDSFDEYEVYSQVERHMNISITLFLLNKQCQQLIEELETKKNVSKKRGGHISKVINCIYTNLTSIVNYKRLSSNIYIDLLSELDNIMFNVCRGVDCFYINEESYNLECMYFNHEKWIKEIEWNETEIFHFEESNDLDVDESMYIMMYLRKYNTMLTSLQNDYIRNEELEQITKRMLEKVNDCIHILIPVIEDMITNVS